MKFILTINFLIFLFSKKAFAQNNDDMSMTSYVMETILGIFRDDNTALMIAGAMIVLALFLIIDYRQRISLPVIKDLKNINNLFSKTYNSESFSENIDDIKEKLQAPEFHNIRPVWFEFNETLTNQTDKEGRLVWFNTKRPEEYFTPTSITRNRGNFNSIESLGNFFVGS